MGLGIVLIVIGVIVFGVWAASIVFNGNIASTSLGLLLGFSFLLAGILFSQSVIFNGLDAKYSAIVDGQTIYFDSAMPDSPIIPKTDDWGGTSFNSKYETHFIIPSHYYIVNGFINHYELCNNEMVIDVPANAEFIIQPLQTPTPHIISGGAKCGK